MVMRISLLLDGCSLTYGLNLPASQTLEHHFFECGYEVTNVSRPGKSNQAIALSLYEHAPKHDLIVAGWTFSSRWYMRYHQQNIDLLPTRSEIELPEMLDADELEQSYRDLHRSFYSVFDSAHWNQVSDMLVDTTGAWLKQQQKQTVFFSWEPRSCLHQIYFPHMPPGHRLPCGHLNQLGTKKLFENLTHIIEQ